MRAVIYTGGEIYPELVTERPEKGDLVLAADAGLRAAERFGVVPDILLGDFDSLGIVPDHSPKTEIVRVPAEKDETDTQLAVAIARERGATEILIIGGFGGRLDHTLANLALLEGLSDAGISALMVNGKTRARVFREGKLSIPADSRFRYLSLIPIDPMITDVCISGCKYPLSHATLLREKAAFSTSNEIVLETAELSIGHGKVWILECANF